MDVESEKVYMQNLEDYIFDESKIVTYKWLSNNLSIHLNAAKQLMEKFINEQKAKNTKVAFDKIYYVSGILKNNKGMVSTVLKEENLTSYKESLETIISEHIYSIHKGGSSTDANALFLAGEHKDECIGVIKNCSITKRTCDELSSLRLGAYPKSLSDKKCVPLPSKNSKESKSNRVIPQDPVVHKESTSNGVNSKDPVIHKEGENKDIGSNNIKSNATAPVNKPKQNKTGIAGFFSKQINNPKLKVEKEIPESEPSKVQIPIGPTTNGIKKEIVSPVKLIKSPDKKGENISKSSNQNSSERETRNLNESKKKQKQPVSRKVPTKKRKRIQTLDSESEEDINVDDIFAPSSPEVAQPLSISDDEDIIPPTPEIVKTNTNKAPLNSRKRKKIVDKTFMDDDGYIVTKKEEVIESCSDVEDEVENKPSKSNLPAENVSTKTVNSHKKQTSPEAKSKTKKKSPPQGKQQSLMNFFKKATK